MDEDIIYQDFEYANSYKLGEITGQKIIQAVKDNNVQEVKRLMSLPSEKGGLILLRMTAKDKNGKTAKDLAMASDNDDMKKLFK